MTYQQKEKKFWVETVLPILNNPDLVEWEYRGYMYLGPRPQKGVSVTILLGHPNEEKPRKVLAKNKEGKFWVADVIELGNYFYHGEITETVIDGPFFKEKEYTRLKLYKAPYHRFDYFNPIDTNSILFK